MIIFLLLLIACQEVTPEPEISNSSQKITQFKLSEYKHTQLQWALKAEEAQKWGEQQIKLNTLEWKVYSYLPNQMLLGTSAKGAITSQGLSLNAPVHLKIGNWQIKLPETHWNRKEETITSSDFLLQTSSFQLKGKHMQLKKPYHKLSLVKPHLRFTLK